MPDEAPRVLALLSHELRGPFGVIRGYLRLLDQSATELSDRSREAVVAALRASDRLAEVLDEASLLAHLQIGDFRLDPKKTPLDTLLQSAIQAAALPAGFRIGLDLAALPPATIEADVVRLPKALASLIGVVARAHSNATGVELTATPTRLREHAAVALRVLAHPTSELPVSEADFMATRGGYGLALPIASLVLQRHGGLVRELRHGDRSAGMLITLPVA